MNPNKNNINKKKILFYLENRGGIMSLWHLIVLNLGGLYYIENKNYHVRYDNSEILHDDRRVDHPTIPVTNPINIYLETGHLKGPLKPIIKEVFNILSDKYILLEEIPESYDYEIISIYGARCDKNTALNNPKVIPFLRDLFLSRINMNININYPKRFFIARNLSQTYNTKKIRTILNEKEFIKNLKKYDIHPIYLEKLSLKQKILLFYNAELIISTNSSALTCLLWSNTKVKVIEIRNKDIGCGKGVHYKLICDTLNLQYYKYSDINDDNNGNFIIPDNSKIYPFIETLL